MRNRRARSNYEDWKRLHATLTMTKLVVYDYHPYSETIRFFGAIRKLLGDGQEGKELAIEEW